MADFIRAVCFLKGFAAYRVCIEKQFTDITSEQITVFACSNENIYDGKPYDLLGKVYFESELRDFVSNNGIAEFYCFGSYIYIRNFSDYGVIGKIIR